MFTMPYGPKWRAFRTIIHQILSPKMTQTFLPTQEFEVKQLLSDLAFANQNETEFYNHIRRMSFSVIMTSTYGRRIDSWNHPDVRYSGESSRLLGKLTASFVEDAFPPLLYLPHWMHPGRARAVANAEPILWAKMRLWNGMKEEISAGRAPACFGRELIESDFRAKGLTDEDAAWIAGGIVEAGSETSGVTLNNLMLYLTAYPAVQERAHAELDQVVGQDRIPSFDDLRSLQYVRGCVKEILRLCPVPSLGLKHFTDGEVRYKDVVIPKGTVVLGNTAAVHYDPQRYPEPFAFKPERYLGFDRYSSEYAAMSDARQRDHFTFGAGRRICPGARLAENTLELALANILWAFDVRPPLTIREGKKVDADVDLTDSAFDKGAFRAPKQFKARFLVRSERHLDILRQQWESAKAEGYMLRGQTVTVDGVVK